MRQRHTYPSQAPSAVEARRPRLRTVLASGVLAVAVAACTGNIGAPTAAPSASPAPSADGSPATSPSAAPAEPVTLKFTPFPLWTGVTGTEPDGQPQEYWRQLADAYTAEHPTVTIEIEMGDWATSTQTLAAQLTAGNPPDVMYLCDGNALTYNEYLVDLDPFITADHRADIIDATWDLYTVDGAVQILPAMVQWNTLIVNADLFRERNVPLPADPERAWTWDEFMTAVRALTFTRANGSKVCGTAIAGIAAANDIEWYNLHYLFNRGARFMDPDLKTFTINEPAGVEALQWLLDLQDKEQVVPAGGAGIGWEDAWGMLFRGQIAMWHGAPWVLSWAESESASGSIDKAPDLQIVQYPTQPGSPMVTDIASCGFGVFDATAEPARTAAAVDFALFATSTEKLRDWTAGNYIPARLSAADGLYEDANMSAYARQAEFGQHFWSRASDILAYADAMNAVLPAVLNHEKTPQQALDDFVTEAQPVFDAGLATP